MLLITPLISRKRFYGVLSMAVIIYLNTVAAGYADSPTAATIGRSQDIIRENEALRRDIEQEKKFFVGKIIIKGASKLSEKEIKETIAPFEENWMTNKDIQQIINALKAAYVKKGIETRHLKITCELKKSGSLEINLKS